MEKRQATSTNGKAKVDEEQMDKRQTNIDHQSQKQTPKRHPRTENWPQEGRKWHHKRPKMVPRRAEEGAKTIPNRKSNQEAHQDYPKIVLGSPQGATRRLFPHLQGSIWAPQNDPKRTLKRSKIKAKIENRKKAIQEDQGPVLERSWSLWGRHVGARRPQKYWKTYYFVQNHFFEDKMVRRRFWDQLRPTKAPKGAKMTPKRDPRSSPKRPKTDIKIDLNLNAKTKRVGQGSARRLWAGTPPQGAAPCARYTSIHYT